MHTEKLPARIAHFRSPAIRDTLRSAVYSNGNERLRHRRYIEEIAQRLRQPVEVVAPLYERILLQLRPAARVHDFLPIFVAKQVRRRFETRVFPDVLRKRSHPASRDYIPGQSA